MGFTITGYGLTISKTHLMLINNKDCVYPDLSNLFTIEDVTDQVNELMDDVDCNVKTFKTILAGNDEPQVLTGQQCEKPYPCPFKEYCWRDVPEKSIFTIPSFNNKHKKAELIKKGIFNLGDIPSDFPLSQKQWVYVNSVLDAQPIIDLAAIKRLISDLEYPIHFLDFETDDPAIPRFNGLRPYQQFPFQYSCHVMQSDGTVTHHEYLHTDESDPRKPLLESLLNHISPRGSVVVYTLFERERLNELIDTFPQHSSALKSIINRLWDQSDIFKYYYKHPDFCGYYSLKNVLPVLVPWLGYEHLDVQEGTEAQAVWNLMLNTTSETKKNEMIEHLKAYCKLDTLATLEIHKVLCGIVEE